MDDYHLRRLEWESRLNPVTSLLRGWIWETDVAHRFIYMSETVRQFADREPTWHYGKTREELGNHPCDIIGAESYREAIAACRPFGPIEFRRAQDGASMWMRTIGEPIFDRNDRFSGYFGIAYDIRGEMMYRELREQSTCVLFESARLIAEGLAALPFGVAVFNQFNTLVHANDLFASMQGIDMRLVNAGARLDGLLQHMCAKGEIIGTEPEAWANKLLELVCERVWHKSERARRNGNRIEMTCLPLDSGGVIILISDVTCRVEMQWKLDKTLRDLDRRTWELKQSQQLVHVLGRLARASEVVDH